MEILRKRGKEKLRLRNMSQKISNSDFQYYKKLFLECIIENKKIVNSLNKYYRRIQVYFFYDRKDTGVGQTVKEFLSLPTVPIYEGSQPATAVSKDGLGCILFFHKHMNETTVKRDDIVNVRDFHKNGVFEELCHLVEQQGDSSNLPESVNELIKLYNRFLGKKIDVGIEIISQLDSNRNHFEVYLMIMNAYPKSWFVRFTRFYEGESDPKAYKEKYAGWKNEFPREIAMARLFSDYIKNLSFMFAITKFPRELLSTDEEKILDDAIFMGNYNLESKKELLSKELSLAESDINSIDEVILETPENFFNFILDFWTRYKLI